MQQDHAIAGHHRVAGGLEWLEGDSLQQLDGIRHAFFTRKGGESDGIYGGLNVGFGSDDHDEVVARNRSLAAGCFGAEADQLSTVYQVHGNDVAVLDAPLSRAQAPKADGMVTKTPNVMLGILTADCTPVLFCDPKAGVIGACHSGWRGTVAGISAATVEAMEKIGADRANIRAVIGPCIGRQSYEVDTQFRDRILETEQGDESLFDPSGRQGHFLFDLPDYVRRKTSVLGLGSVDVILRDTLAEEDLFYSYRRTTLRGEPDYGRLLSAIMIEA